LGKEVKVKHRKLKIGYGMVVTFLLGLLLVAACATSVTPTPVKKSTTPEDKDVQYSNPQLLAETGWLDEHLEEANLRIVDIRSKDSYDGGHIKNSVSLPASDVASRLYDQDAELPYIVAPQEQFEALMEELGISNDTTVVVLDEGISPFAGRVFWTLEYYGHENVKLLNGGLKKWKAEGRTLVTEATEVEPVSYTADPQPQRLAVLDEIKDGMDAADTAIIATIPQAEFEGGNVKNTKRGGHIPGGLQIDWMENLTGDDVPVFKSAPELAAVYEAAGVTRDKNVIVY
jgi:thiosulfate/3-mercaptopyruvate sulfurtransferase